MRFNGRKELFPHLKVKFSQGKIPFIFPLKLLKIASEMSYSNVIINMVSFILFHFDLIPNYRIITYLRFADDIDAFTMEEQELQASKLRR